MTCASKLETRDKGSAQRAARDLGSQRRYLPKVMLAVLQRAPKGSDHPQSSHTHKKNSHCAWAIGYAALARRGCPRKNGKDQRYTAEGSIGRQACQDIFTTVCIRYATGPRCSSRGLESEELISLSYFTCQSLPRAFLFRSLEREQRAMAQDQSLPPFHSFQEPSLCCIPFCFRSSLCFVIASLPCHVNHRNLSNS